RNPCVALDFYQHIRLSIMRLRRPVSSDTDGFFPVIALKIQTVIDHDRLVSRLGGISSPPNGGGSCIKEHLHHLPFQKRYDYSRPIGAYEAWLHQWLSYGTDMRHTSL